MSRALLLWLTHFGDWTYLVVFGLVFAESGLLLLLPGETVVVLAGVLASRGILSLPVLCGVAATAAMGGDACGYLLGRGPARGRFETHGRFLFLQVGDVERVKRLLGRHHGWAIVGSRFVGLLRVATPFVCGLINLTPRQFFPYNLPACAVWGVGVAALGYLGGNAWETLHRWVGRGTLGIGVLAVAAALLWNHRQRSRKKA